MSASIGIEFRDDRVRVVGLARHHRRVTVTGVGEVAYEAEPDEHVVTRALEDAVVAAGVQASRAGTVLPPRDAAVIPLDGHEHLSRAEQRSAARVRLSLLGFEDGDPVELVRAPSGQVYGGAARAGTLLRIDRIVRGAGLDPISVEPFPAAWERVLPTPQHAAVDFVPSSVRVVVAGREHAEVREVAREGRSESQIVDELLELFGRVNAQRFADIRALVVRVDAGGDSALAQRLAQLANLSLEPVAVAGHTAMAPYAVAYAAALGTHRAVHG